MVVVLIHSQEPIAWTTTGEDFGDAVNQKTRVFEHKKLEDDRVGFVGEAEHDLAAQHNYSDDFEGCWRILYTKIEFDEKFGRS